MALKVFCTGTTGYIGGDALSVIVKAHPDWEITCLVRNSSKGAKVAAEYPKIRLVYGDLDAVDLITEEAQKTDIVYHFANCDHEASAKAISKGLAAAGKDVYWIHTSGSLIIGWETTAKDCYGELLPKVYNDWDGVGELVNLPDQAYHRVVDKIVLATSAEHANVKTAIVCPPTIYGAGRGPDNQRSQQAYVAAQKILEHKKGFMVGKGENIWHQVHVQDLSDIYLSLGEAAAEGGGVASWNSEGYYLAENGSFVWGAIFQQLTQLAHQKGLIPSGETSALSTAEIKEIWRVGVLVWGTNSRGQAIRARKLFGWKPHRPSLEELLPDIVEQEAKALGLIQGHAAKVVQ